MLGFLAVLAPGLLIGLAIFLFAYKDDIWPHDPSL